MENKASNKNKILLVVILVLMSLTFYFISNDKSETTKATKTNSERLFTPFEAEVAAEPLCCACIYIASEMRTGTCYKELDNGTAVKVIGQEGEAYRVEYKHPNGEPTKGWTNKSWIKRQY